MSRASPSSITDDQEDLAIILRHSSPASVLLTFQSSIFVSSPWWFGIGYSLEISVCV